jgi:parallel beta-helix repeat protein
MRRLATALLVVVAACSSGGSASRVRPSPTFSDAPATVGPCTNVMPSSNIQAAVDASPPGTTFCFAAGRYALPAPLAPKDGDRLIGSPGAVLTGNDRVKYAIRSSASNVTVRGLEIEHFASPLQDGAIQKDGGKGWLIEANNIHDNAAAGVFWKGDGDRIVGNTLNRNGQEGFSCSHATNSLLDGNEIAYNNTRKISINWEAGGGKVWSSSYVTMSNNYVHNNIGPGLWSDTNNIHITYEGNVVENNTSYGIFHEVSYDAIIRNNTLSNNGFNGKWLGPAGIWIANSSNVQVYGNTLFGDGIFGVEQQRGSGDRGPWLLRNIDVHGNRITVWLGPAAGVDADNGDGLVFAGSNAFSDNTYSTPAGCPCWAWRGDDVVRSGWVAAGQDRTGTFADR